MEYVGFFPSKIKFDGYEWYEPFIFDRQDEYKHAMTYYYVKAKTPEEARYKVFEEYYSECEEDDTYIDCWYEIHDLSEYFDYEDDYFFKEYGENDGKVLDEIWIYWNSMDRKEWEALDPFPMDDRFLNLSDSTKKKLSFNHIKHDIAIAPMTKL